MKSSLDKSIKNKSTGVKSYQSISLRSMRNIRHRRSTLNDGIGMKFGCFPNIRMADCKVCLTFTCSDTGVKLEIKQCFNTLWNTDFESGETNAERSVDIPPRRRHIKGHFKWSDVGWSNNQFQGCINADVAVNWKPPKMDQYCVDLKCPQNNWKIKNREVSKKSKKKQKGTKQKKKRKSKEQEFYSPVIPSITGFEEQHATKNTAQSLKPPKKSHEINSLETPVPKSIETQTLPLGIPLKQENPAQKQPSMIYPLISQQKTYPYQNLAISSIRPSISPHPQPNKYYLVYFPQQQPGLYYQTSLRQNNPLPQSQPINQPNFYPVRVQIPGYPVPQGLPLKLQGFYNKNFHIPNYPLPQSQPISPAYQQYP